MSKCTCRPAPLKAERCDWCKQNERIAEKAREMVKLYDERVINPTDWAGQIFEPFCDLVRALPAEEVG